MFVNGDSLWHRSSQCCGSEGRGGADVELNPRTDTLRKRLEDGRILVAPGAFNALTALLVERAGFEAAYATGAGIANAFLGVPDLRSADTIGDDGSCASHGLSDFYPTPGRYRHGLRRSP